MKFPHEDSEFSQLLLIVAGKRKLSLGLVEKDYWVTHALWALHQDSDLEIWFKGGTSLSKGFGLIQRFSEDLDLRIDSTAAGIAGLSWPKKPTKTQEARHIGYFQALGTRLKVAGAKVSTMAIDPGGRGGEYKDAARIILEEDQLPFLEQTLEETAAQMAPTLRLKRVAPTDHPAFSTETAKAPRLQEAYEAIAPMFWAPRLSLNDACGIIRKWCEQLES